MNRQIWWLLLLILIWPKPLLSQLPGNASLVLFPSVPSGNCNSRQLALDESNGSLYTCTGAAGGTNRGTWQIIAGGGGGGGWNPPQVSGDTLFGNNTVGTSAPSFFIPNGDVSFSAGNFSVNSLHFGPNVFSLSNTGIANGNCLQVSGGSIIGGACGTGGAGAVTSVFTRTGAIAAEVGDYAAFYAPIGSILQGCHTQTSGNLVCDNSIQGGTGNVGMLTMPFSSGGLPTPPTGNYAAIAPDAGGNLFWSPGNSTAFVAIGTGSGGPAGVASFNGRTGPVMPQASDYAEFFAPIGATGGGGVATALQFGQAAFSLSPTAPANFECLAVNGDTIIGISCGQALGGVTIIQ